MSISRYVGIAALALGGAVAFTALALAGAIAIIPAVIAGAATTVIGVSYLAAKTNWIQASEVGIANNFLTGKIETLEPGVHTLVSPMLSFIRTMPFKKYRQERLETFEIKTADNVDAMVQADFTFHVTDAKQAYMGVENLEYAVKEQVKGALSSILQEQPYNQIKTSALAIDRKDGESKDSQSSSSALSSIAGATSSSSTDHPDSQSTARYYFNQLKEKLATWGVIASNFRIISVEPKGQRVMEAMEETLLIEQRARAKLNAANLDAEATQIHANAEANAAQIRAKGAASAFNELGEGGAQEVYRLGIQLEATKALVTGNVVSLGGTTGTAVLPSLLKNAATLYSAARTGRTLTSSTPTLAMQPVK